MHRKKNHQNRQGNFFFFKYQFLNVLFQTNQMFYNIV